MSVLDDVKGLKAWIMGAIAFDASVTTLLVSIFNTDPVKTTIATTATTIVALAIILLIYKTENRLHKELQEHIKESNELRGELNDCMLHNRETLADIRRDTLRIQLAQYLKDQPDNVDTILMLAEEYFCKLKGDWYMTNEFVNWAEAHHVKPEIVLSCKVEKD